MSLPKNNGTTNKRRIIGYRKNNKKKTTTHTHQKKYNIYVLFPKEGEINIGQSERRFAGLSSKYIDMYIHTHI